MTGRTLRGWLRAQGYLVLAVVPVMALMRSAGVGLQVLLLILLALVLLPGSLLCAVAVLHGSLRHGFRLARLAALANAALLPVFALATLAAVVSQAAMIEKKGLEGLVAVFFCLYFTLLWAAAAVVHLMWTSRLSESSLGGARIATWLLLLQAAVLALLTFRAISPLAWIGMDPAARFELGRAAWGLFFRPAALVALAVLIPYGVLALGQSAKPKHDLADGA